MAGVKHSPHSTDAMGREAFWPTDLKQVKNYKPPASAPSVSMMSPPSSLAKQTPEVMGYYYWRHRQHVYLPCLDNEERMKGFWLQEYPVSLHNWDKNATTMRRYHDIIYNGAECSFEECGGYRPKIHDYLPEFWDHMQWTNAALRTDLPDYARDENDLETDLFEIQHAAHVQVS